MIRLAWLAAYPIGALEPDLPMTRPAGSGHACSWIVHLSNALAKRDDVEFHLITESPRVARDASVKKLGIHFHVLKSSVPVLNRGFPGWLPLDALSGFFLLRHRIMRKIRELGPDLVHAHGTEAAYGAAAVRCGLPCVISIQGIITEYCKQEPTMRYRLVRPLELEQVRRCRYFTCRTHWDTGFVRRVNPDARIFQIEEAMNPLYFENEWGPNENPSVLYVGALNERKGILFLIEAISRVKTSFPDIRLTVVGGGSAAWRERCDSLCRGLGLTENVSFAGSKNAREIAALHRSHQVFVLASRIENSPNVVAEAMVSGMPVIATDVGGLSSMVEDGVTGLLVQHGNVGQLADRITFLLNNRAERERLGAAARRVGRQRHCPEAVAEKTVSAYREILGASIGQ